MTTNEVLVFGVGITKILFYKSPALQSLEASIFTKLPSNFSIVSST